MSDGISISNVSIKRASSRTFSFRAACRILRPTRKSSYVAYCTGLLSSPTRRYVCTLLPMKYTERCIIYDIRPLLNKYLQGLYILLGYPLQGFHPLIDANNQHVKAAVAVASNHVCPLTSKLFSYSSSISEKTKNVSYFLYCHHRPPVLLAALSNIPNPDGRRAPGW